MHFTAPLFISILTRNFRYLSSALTAWKFLTEIKFFLFSVQKIINWFFIFYLFHLIFLLCHFCGLVKPGYMGGSVVYIVLALNSFDESTFQSCFEAKQRIFICIARLGLL